MHESLARSAYERSLRPIHTYYLRNRRLGEAVPGASHPLATAANALRFTSFHVGVEGNADGLVVRELLLHFSVPSGPGGRSIVLDEAWTADAELVVMSTTRAGTVERDLDIDDFPLTLPTRAGF